VKWIASLVGTSAIWLASAGASQAGNCAPCGGCSDPCDGKVVRAKCCAAGESLCEPIKSFKVVMEAKFVTESRPICVTEMRKETRYRTKTVYETVPVVETKHRQKCVMVLQTEIKTIKYSVLVPVKSEKTVELTESVPVWNEVSEEYTVCVPELVDASEEYCVKVAKLQDESFTYCVNVPHPVVEKKVRRVVNAVPVTKTRTIQVCVPKTTMRTVTKDYGHWENQVCEAPSCSASPCKSTRTKRVWVPNCVTEKCPVTTNSTRCEVVSYTCYEQQCTEVPYECTRIVYKPETRTGTKKTCVYVDEKRTRTRKVVKYSKEKRTRTRKELSYKTVTKKVTVPHVTYKTEEKTKEVCYTVNVPEYSTEEYQVTRCDRVAHQKVEEYTVCVPHCVTKEQKVQVCKMVPKVVECIVNPCCCSK
jgi:hypothetical protein